MLKNAVIMLVVALGFLIAPMEVSACHKSSEKEQSCCAKHNQDADTSDADHVQETGDHEPDCNGTCTHSSCHCVTLHHIQVIVPHQPYAALQSFFYQKEESFVYIEAYTSTGFYTIWQPPKLG